MMDNSIDRKMICIEREEEEEKGVWFVVVVLVNIKL